MSLFIQQWISSNGKSLSPFKHVVRSLIFDFWFMHIQKIQLEGKNEPCVSHKFSDEYWYS
jgi:hypothetical protein